MKTTGFSQQEHWGLDGAFDCFDCDKDAIRSKETVRAFAYELCKRINMKMFGEPWIENFGEGDKEGLTLVQLISTSDITAHFANDLNAVYLNVFSCKDYDPKVVEECVREFFGAKSFVTNVKMRYRPSARK